MMAPRRASSAFGAKSHGGSWIQVVFFPWLFASTPWKMKIWNPKSWRADGWKMRNSGLQFRMILVNQPFIFQGVQFFFQGSGNFSGGGKPLVS